MPLTLRLINPPSARPRQRAARRGLFTLLVMLTSAGAALAAGPSSATRAPGKASATTAKKASTPKGKPATPRQQLKSEAEGLALATATVETITEAQLNVAMRVLTGQADCEFNERVTVAPLDGQPGHFLVGHKGLRYTMVPEETATGAVRLVDRRAGVVWLQIPVKSMLMNSKQGRRMVDACTHAEQRVAVTAVADAGAGLGIVPTAAAAPMAAAVPVAAAAPISAAAPAASAALATPAATLAAPVTATPAATAASEVPLVPAVPEAPPAPDAKVAGVAAAASATR